MNKNQSKNKVEFCEFADKMNENGSILIKPIGKARNAAKEKSLTGWKNLVTEIIIDKEYGKGLDGIEDYSHVIIVYWMGKEEKCHLRHHPQGREDVPYGGIFSCRCPQRPNRIAMSTVKLLSRKNNRIKVKGLDILDGTPIIDVKPYWPNYDRVERARIPRWVNKLKF